MLVEIDVEAVMATELVAQLGYTLTSIETFKNLEYLEQYQADDLEYDLNLLSALRKVAKHFSIPTEWDLITEYQVHCDLVVDEFPGLVYDFDDLYAGDGVE